MARIEVECPDCGPVVCTGADLELRQFGATTAFYVFVCPECRLLIQRPADGRAIGILRNEGAQIIDLVVPAEAQEAHEGPLFTVDDIIEFHQLLERPDWFRSVLR